jgi:hypothetical protein
MADYSQVNPIIQAVGPEDLNTAANDGTYVCMKDYRSMEIHILIGDLAGGTAVVTVEQATTLAAAGEKALAFTKYYRTGQKLKINTVVGTFVAAETVTGTSSGNTAVVNKVSSGHLIISPVTGSTTWTDGEILTGTTSGATALVSGTGEGEDMLVEMPAVVNTFTTLAIAFRHYMIPIDAEMLDKANGFDCVHVKIAQAGVGETQGCAFYVMKDPRQRVYPQMSALAAVKIV